LRRPWSTELVSSEQPRNLLLEELQWVHGMLRRDLEACRQLASSIEEGAASTDVQVRLREMQSRSPLFQLRVNCMRYCRFVHAHHGAEDAMLFPSVRRSAPHLAQVVDRLESDHRKVADLLDAIEVTATDLGGAGDSAIRARLVGALGDLSTLLLEHLAFEEASLGPVLAGWQHWPFYA
jgi:hypothetical protein